jgi:hypothetical protein
MIEFEKLKKRLEETGMKIRGIDVPENANPSSEELAETINKCLDAIEIGDYEDLDDLPD